MSLVALARGANDTGLRAHWPRPGVRGLHGGHCVSTTARRERIVHLLLALQLWRNNKGPPQPLTVATRSKMSQTQSHTLQCCLWLMLVPRWSARENGLLATFLLVCEVLAPASSRRKQCVDAAAAAGLLLLLLLLPAVAACVGAAWHAEHICAKRVGLSEDHRTLIAATATSISSRSCSSRSL